MKEIRTNSDLIRVFQEQISIQIWYDGELSDTGPIQQLGLRAIKVNDMHYVKRQCQFFIVEEAR